jgi:small subunit ribosomal protein S4
MVNDKMVNVPSFQVKPGMKIRIAESMQNNLQVREAIGKTAAGGSSYLEVSRPDLSFTLLSVPSRDMIPVELNENLVIEFYSK